MEYWNRIYPYLISQLSKIIGIILFLKIADASGAAYYYCPNNCTCSFTRGIVKCEGTSNSIPSIQIPSGISIKTIQLSLANYSLPVLDLKRISNLKKLRDLRLRKNQISKISPSTFLNLRRLTTLDLSYNDIEQLKDSVFVHLSVLRKLDLSHNSIINLGTSCQKLPKMVQLDLGFNKIQQLPQQTFSRCKDLRFLHIENNAITLIEPHTFLNLTKLSKLKLRGNKLASSNMTFHHFLSHTLQTIDLSDNGFSQVPPELPEGLQEIRLSSNSIKTLGPEDFFGYHKLESLYLQSNNISSIHTTTFSTAGMLRKIWLNDNSLISIPILPGNLTDLYLQDNRIGPNISAISLSGISKLSRLSLQSNAIEYLEPGAFAPLGTSLKTLMLHNNRLSAIFNDTFKGLVNLNLLSLSKNPLVTLGDHCFRGLTSLKVLRLSHSSGVPRIDGLNDVIHSSVKADDYDGSEPNTNLILSNLNPQMIINCTVFEDMNNLEVLSLTNNTQLVHTILLRNLSSCSGNITFPHLAELEIGDNGLEYLPSDFVNLFPQLIELYLSHNPWNCDKLIITLLNLLNSPTMKIKDRDELVCHSPEAFLGRHISNLSLEEVEEMETPTSYLVPDYTEDYYEDYTSTREYSTITQTTADQTRAKSIHEASIVSSAPTRVITTTTIIITHLQGISQSQTTNPTPHPSTTTHNTFNNHYTGARILTWETIFCLVFVVGLVILVATYFTWRRCCHRSRRGTKLLHDDSYSNFEDQNTNDTNDDDTTPKNFWSFLRLGCDNDEKSRNISCHFKRGSSNIRIINSVNPCFGESLTTAPVAASHGIIGSGASLSNHIHPLPDRENFSMGTIDTDNYIMYHNMNSDLTLKLIS